MRRKKWCWWVSAAVGLMLLFQGCTATKVEAKPSETASPSVWSARRFQQEFCGKDSWEPFNRSMFGVFDWCMEYVVDPFCVVYSTIIPKPLIHGIDRVSENLESPVRIFSSLLMGEWKPAWVSTERFFINSTLGLGGFFDPAEDYFYLADSESNFADTFAAWGIPAGPPLALPFSPRGSVRGHVGYLFDYALDIKTWLDLAFPSEIYLGYTSALVPNKAPIWCGQWESLFGYANDGYSVYMPLASALSDFNLHQFVWNYRESLYQQAKLQLEAEQHQLGSPEREALMARAKEVFVDVRPPVHESASRPAGLEGRWVEIPGFAPRGPALDSLRALCFDVREEESFWWEERSLFNRSFKKSIKTREIELGEDCPCAKYSFVAAREPKAGELPKEKLVFVLPGIGAHRTSTDAVAMAELLQAQGYSVVICNSLFHWEHMSSVNKGLLPGYLPEDMRRYADYLGKILVDLQEDGEVLNPEVSLVGWSMGGLTVAHFAALEVAGQLPFKVAHFVAINPPTSMEHALAKFVPVYESSRWWSREYAYKMLTEVARSLTVWAMREHPRFDPAQPPVDEIGQPWNYAPNISEDEANYLLGQTIRVIFPALVAERQKVAPFPWIKSELTWFHRNDFYDEVGDLSLEDYIRRYVPTCYPGVSAETMIAASELWCLEEQLVKNEKLVLFHTWNDPLEDDTDRLRLDRLLGSRITWFADGGHCGYFYTKPFETELLRQLRGE